MTYREEEDTPMIDWTPFDEIMDRWTAVIARVSADVDIEPIGPLNVPSVDFMTLDAHCRLRHGLRILSMHRSPEWFDAWQSMTGWGTRRGILPYHATEDDEAFLASLPGWMLVVRPLHAAKRLEEPAP
jgi:hypothetical protein